MPLPRYADHAAEAEGRGLSSEHITFDVQALAIVAGLVRRAINGGGNTAPNHLWEADKYQRSVPGLHSCARQLDSWVSTTKARIVELRNVQNILAQVSESAQQLESQLETVLLRTTTTIGFRRLPSEIVLRILKFAGCEHAAQRRDAQLVCRRFCSLIAGTSGFWTRLSNNMKPEDVDLFLVRSKNAELSIYLELIDDGIHASVAFLHKVVPLCARWRSFRYSTKFSFVSDAVVARIHSMLSNLSLPILHEAHFSFPSTDVFGYATDPRDEVWHFYKSWNAPALCDIGCMNMTLEVNKTFKAKSCSMTFCEDDGPPTWDPVRFSRSLSHQDRLQTLVLSLENIHNISDAAVFSSNGFQLPSLRELSITATQETPAKTVTEVLYPLRMPSLDSFNLKIQSSALNDFDMIKILTCSITTVKDFTLTVIGDAGKFNPLGIILKRMPNLRNLTLESPDVSMTANVPFFSHQILPLQTINFRRCKGLTEDGLRPLISVLEGNTNFRELRLSGCQDIHTRSPGTKERLEGLLPGRKIVLE